MHQAQKVAVKRDSVQEKAVACFLDGLELCPLVQCCTPFLFHLNLDQ